MVPDDIAQLAVLHLAAHIGQMDEALVPFRILRLLSGGQQALIFHGDVLGVDHLVLGGAGVDVQAVEGHAGGGGIEVLILDLSHRAAVGGIGIVRAKALDIKLICAPADLLVGSEADLQGGVLPALGQQDFRSGENLRHTGLVVRPQKGGAVGDDQVLAVVAFQGLIVGFPEINALFPVQEDVSPVVFHNPRPDICAAGIGGGVHVGDKADGGKAGVSGDGAVDIAVFIHAGILNAHGKHLLHDGLSQNLLLFRRRASLGRFV